MSETKSRPVLLGVDDFNKWLESITKASDTKASDWEKANSDFKQDAKVIEENHDRDYKELNKQWSESFKPKARSKPLAYNERSEIITRRYYASLTDAKLRIFDKYKLGNVPVSEYEMKLWQREHDPRTGEIDKLSIARSLASSRFGDMLVKEIEASALKGKKLRYDKEHELGMFSSKLQRMDAAMQKMDSRLNVLKNNWPRGRDEGVNSVAEMHQIEKNRGERPKEVELDLEENAAIHAWYGDHPEKDKYAKHKPKLKAKRKSRNVGTTVKGMR